MTDSCLQPEYCQRMHEICMWFFEKKEGLQNLEEDNVSISISITATISTPFVSKWSPAFPPENLPSQLRRYCMMKVVRSSGCLDEGHKRFSKAKIRNSLNIRWMHFSSSSTPAPNSLFPLEVTSYPILVYGQRGECYGLNVCVTSDLHVGRTLIPNLIVFGDGAFGW